MQDTSEPVVSTQSPITGHIEAMARASCGLTPFIHRERASGLRRWFSRVAKKAGPSTESGDLKAGTSAGANASSKSSDDSKLPVGLACKDEERVRLGGRSSLPWNY
jgi:hypothetical protein